jgi:hypothetical protein
MALRILGPRSRAGLSANPVCMPKPDAMASTVTKSIAGMAAAGMLERGPVIANTIKTSRAVDVNSDRNAPPAEVLSF